MPNARKPYVSLMILMLMAAFSVGCVLTGDYPGTTGKVFGKWKFKDPNNGPQTLTFLRDYTYELDYDGDGNKDIWGSYRISRDWLIMNDVGGDFLFDCGQQGAYLYRVKDGVLTFTLMADQCPPRHQAMSVEWVKVPRPGFPRVTPVIKI